MAWYFDRAELKQAVHLDNGFVRAPAIFSRVGVFSYLDKSGKIVKVARLPEDLFRAETLSSFELAPLTLNHPYEHKGVVHKDNYRELSVGSVGNLRPDGDFLHGEVVIQDSNAIEAVESGTDQLSLGYQAELVPAEPNAKYQGQAYDFRQTNIRGNHVAIVSKGRAGPEARIYLDGDDGDFLQLVTEDVKMSDTQQETPVEAPKAEVVLDAVPRAEFDAVVARAEKADAEIARLTAALAEAQNPATLQAAIKARAALELKAKTIAPDLDISALSNTEVMRKAVVQLDSAINLEGKSDETVEAVFESVLHLHSQRNAVTEAARSETAVTTLDSETSVIEAFYKQFDPYAKK